MTNSFLGTSVLVTQASFSELTQKFDHLYNVIMSSADTTTKVYTNASLCELLGVNRRTLQKWRDEGVIGFSQINRKIFYTHDDLLEMLRRYRIDPISVNSK